MTSVLPAAGETVFSICWQNGENAENVDLGACLYSADGRVIDVCCFTKPIVGDAFRHTRDAGVVADATEQKKEKQGENRELIGVATNAVESNVALILFVVCVRNEKKKAMSKLFSRFFFACDQFDFRHDFLAIKTKNKSFCPIVCRRTAAQQGKSGNSSSASPLPFELLPTAALGNVDCCKKAGIENIWPLCNLVLQQFLDANAWQTQNSVDPLHLANHQTAFLPLLKKNAQKEEMKNDDDGERAEDGEEEGEGAAEKKIFFGLGWESRCDVDAHCYQVRADGRLHDHIYFGRKDSKDKSTRLDKDNLTGDGPRGADDERIYVDLNAVDARVQYLCFAVQIYTSGHNFDDVDGEFIRIIDQTSNKTLMRYELDDDDAFDEYDGALVCVVKRLALSWQVEACARPFDKEKSIEPFLRNVLGIK